MCKDFSNSKFEFNSLIQTPRSRECNRYIDMSQSTVIRAAIVINSLTVCVLVFAQS